ncbi:subtilisin-like protease SBT3.17 isoform X2 [Abrus precatorius]|uniref:Subtilisin-like protease SBT3.17 isoform X2 n=1 Tax=Abrus precatorius TaxID=3816 RepID=A0A8B8MF47_ABRPR|nr:subtilisin-like protease SBT3.17 isoform X2 [Abrus precatorius]
MIMISTTNLGFSKPQSLVILVFLALVCIAMSDSAAKPLDQHASGSSPAVHIVYTERPQNEEPEAYHIRTLSAVLGSEEAAKEALLYSYKSAASGFSAKLTPEQVDQISKQPGVLQVVPSRTYQLHSGPGNLH